MISNVISEKYDLEDNTFTNNLINILMAITTILLLLIIFNAPLFVKVFISGFDGETLYLAVRLLKQMNFLYILLELQHYHPYDNDPIT